jgi:hypothetical protein
LHRWLVGFLAGLTAVRDPSTHTSDEEGVMWEFRHIVRTLVSALLDPRRTERRGWRSHAVDWLPPVLGPEDYSIGMMADRSASWYFDRS